MGNGAVYCRGAGGMKWRGHRDGGGGGGGVGVMTQD